jgi:hypothetical protein
MARAFEYASCRDARAWVMSTHCTTCRIPHCACAAAPCAACRSRPVAAGRGPAHDGHEQGKALFSWRHRCCHTPWWRTARRTQNEPPPTCLHEPRDLGVQLAQPFGHGFRRRCGRAACLAVILCVILMWLCLMSMLLMLLGGSSGCGLQLLLRFPPCIVGCCWLACAFSHRCRATRHTPGGRPRRCM